MPYSTPYMLNTIRPFLGFIIVILGIVLFILPIPLGLPIILVGLTLLTPEFKSFNVIVVKVENINPKYGRKLRFIRMKVLRFMGYKGGSL
jgi:hypothetical protein